jgi:nitrilase
MNGHPFTVAIAQIAPVWLDRQKTLDKMLGYVDEAIQKSCDLLVFGEGMLPGYPFWIELTDGARFNHSLQKEYYSIYHQQAVDIGAGDLNPFREKAKEAGMALYLGCIEKENHSVFCSLIFIDKTGEIASVHRKLMPTYEERLVWAQGDGHGLRVHSLPPFTVGGLNCWENWMPLARTSLYAQGENLHVAVWPGSLHNTEDITRFMAKEGRSFVISASSILPVSSIPKSVPAYDLLMKTPSQFLGNGGSCIADPAGNWVIEPVINKECLLTASLDFTLVTQERLLFDPTGHYSRKDVFNLQVDRQRRSSASFKD